MDNKCYDLLLCLAYRDLKRDIAKKLEKLERRTQKAIVELIRKLNHSPQVTTRQMYWKHSYYARELRWASLPPDKTLVLVSYPFLR